MKVAIVDDALQDRQSLYKHIIKYSDEYQIKLKIVQYESAKEFLTEFSKGMFKICFLDIFLEDGNGMDIAREIAKVDSECYIIFLTSSHDYILEGYDVRAWRYLLKPINEERLKDAFFSCIEQIRQSQKTLEVSVNKKDIKVSYSEIIAITSSNRKIELRLEDGALFVDGRVAFSEFVKPLLEDDRFVICNQGILINFQKIHAFKESTIQMINGEEFPISRRKLAQVKSDYMEYSFSKI